MIDVLLVLLIIFMIIQPQNEAKLPVKAMEQAPVGMPSSPETLMLTVSQDMHMELNSTTVELGELGPLLANLMEQRPAGSRVLFIKAPGQFPYSTVVSLIDLAKGVGVVTIGLTQEG